MAFLCIQLYTWLNTEGSLSFSGSYSGTKHVYSSLSAEFMRGIFFIEEMQHWLPHSLITSSSLSDAEAEHCCKCFICGIIQSAGNTCFWLMWVILIYPLTYLLVFLSGLIFSLFDLQQFPHQMPRMPTCISWMWFNRQTLSSTCLTSSSMTSSCL